jgi:mRNA interferase MazF
MPNRGEVWLAHLEPKQGTAPGKTRPVLIVQAQALLDVHHPSTLIVPLTTTLLNHAEPLAFVLLQPTACVETPIC